MYYLLSPCFFFLRKLCGLLRGVLLVSYEMQPFLRNITRFATPSAYPHEKSVSPLNIYFAWPLVSSDQLLINAMKESAASIAAVAREDGQDIDSLPLYPNYCLADTPLERMYGSNLEKLRSTKQIYDPSNVMGRAGGCVLFLTLDRSSVVLTSFLRFKF